MKHYRKYFLHRGLLFGGFGPIVAGIVFYILSLTLEDFSLTGGQLLTAIVSTYLLAFIHAGASVFNQIEHWSVGRSLLCHFLTLYTAYSLCYGVNAWIPFKWDIWLVFTLIFAATYLAIWFTVYFIVRSAEKKLNRKIS